MNIQINNRPKDDFRFTNEESSIIIQIDNSESKVLRASLQLESADALGESSSKSSLCTEIGNLKVKGLVGRPKKISRRRRNPFDFANLGIKNGCKKTKQGTFRKGPIKLPLQGKKVQRLETINEDKMNDKANKAKGIINYAQTLGLQVNLEMSEALKEVS